jgi:hypothetical protein
MKIMRIALLILLITLFVRPAFPRQEGGNGDFTGLGFEFGIEKDQAFKIIKSEGREIIENTVDSKEVRMVVVEGAFIELPVNTSNADLKTKLEFYDDRLMSSSLVFESDSRSKQASLEAELARFLSGLYGEPEKREKVLHFTTWTWQTPDVLVIFSIDPKNDVVRIQQVYEPISRIKLEEEYDEKRGGEPSDPAKEMFLDGNYSRPTQYR